MNDIIESYLKKHICRDYFNSYGETVHDEHYFMYREEIDGLIELIVRECTRWIQESPSTDEGQLILSKSFIVSNIKHNLGIE